MAPLPEPLLPEPLLTVLAGLQDRGAIGTTSLDDAVVHAERYVALLPLGPLTVADLGSGGGLPGLVIAVRRPDLSMVLVERRLARADQLRRAVRALGVTDRVEVHADDVRTLAIGRHLLGLGAKAVVVTLGPAGVALVPGR